MAEGGMKRRKLCRYCRVAFIPHDARHRYCSNACGQAGRRLKREGYKLRSNVATAHITRALDRFEATYGTRVPAEVPEALTDWCVMLQEAAQ